MNDVKFIQEMRIYNIRIAEASNDTANQNVFTVTFSQHVETPDDTGVTYFTNIHHRFCAKTFENAIITLKKIAEIYSNASNQKNQYLTIK